MNCPICGKEKVPTEIVENPISGGMSAVDYMCPDDCEFHEYIERDSAIDSTEPPRRKPAAE